MHAAFVGVDPPSVVRALLVHTVRTGPFMLRNGAWSLPVLVAASAKPTLHKHCAEAIEVLEAAGADVHARLLHSSSALAAATKVGNLVAVTKLLFVGARVNRKFGPQERTALHWAARDLRPLLCRVLLNAGADITVDDVGGRTAPDLVQRRLRHPDARISETEAEEEQFRGAMILRMLHWVARGRPIPIAVWWGHAARTTSRAEDTPATVRRAGCENKRPCCACDSTSSSSGATDHHERRVAVPLWRPPVQRETVGGGPSGSSKKRTRGSDDLAAAPATAVMEAAAAAGSGSTPWEVSAKRARVDGARPVSSVGDGGGAARSASAGADCDEPPTQGGVPGGGGGGPGRHDPPPPPGGGGGGADRTSAPTRRRGEGWSRLRLRRTPRLRTQLSAVCVLVSVRRIVVGRGGVFDQMLYL